MTRPNLKDVSKAESQPRPTTPPPRLAQIHPQPFLSLHTLVSPGLPTPSKRGKTCPEVNFGFPPQLWRVRMKKLPYRSKLSAV